jgi:integrase
VGRYLSDLESSGGIGKRTRNSYLKAVKQFCRWMVKQRRASQSPLEHLDCVSVKVEDIRHGRRALEPDEIRRLLATTAAQPERFGMNGPERALLYRLGIESGLRANELRSLKVASFDFRRDTVTVESQNTKNRKEAVLPLRPDTAAELRQFLAGKLPTAQAFNMPEKTADMLRADLAEAGIEYVDESGRYADFHSLRHTTGSLLAASGVHPKTAQSIMRHSDINLTMSRYTHTLAGQEAQAVASLPDFSSPSKQAQRATGTDGKNLARFLALQDGLDRSGLDYTGQGDVTGAIDNADSNAPGGIRTCNLRFRRPTLYPIELQAQLTVI